VNDMAEKIWALHCEHGMLLESVNLILALEDSPDVELPDGPLRTSPFASTGAIREALTGLDGTEMDGKGSRG
jgi:hypothetical protein